MQSNMHDFPAEEFMECLRNNLSNHSKYLEEVNNLNTEWIYEIIKHCYNTLTEPKQLPSTKLNALILIKDLMETCQIPCFNLIEAYILPIVYEIAIVRPQEKGDKRGSTFFQVNGRANRIPNVEEIGINFVQLCPEILFVGSMIKPQRNFQSQQLQRVSDFFDLFESFKKYGISPAPTSTASLKNFSPEFVAHGRQKYLNNLKSFYRGKNNYSQYFVTKIIDSVETDNNALLNNGQSVSSLSNDLDMRKLLKKGDPLLTTPLIDELLMRLKNIPSFMSKKHCLSLLTDFVKWGDIEALVKICSDGCLDKIGIRIAQVQGNNGLAEGEKIYPEVKGQRDGKRKFYSEFLKSVEVIANCLQNENIEIQQAEAIEGLYRYFKKEKKFEFPQNLMAKKIQTEFQQNLENNMQRNQLILRNLKQNGSINQKGEGRSKNSKIQVGMSATYLEINKNLEDCLEEIFKVTANQKEINVRMTKIIELKNKFEDQIEKIDVNNSQIKEDEVEEILDNGQEITKIVEKLEVLHKDYKNKTINFEQFKQRHASLTKQYEEESLEHSRGSDKNLTASNNLAARNSLEQVVNSFNVKKAKNSQDMTPSFQKIGSPAAYDQVVKDSQPSSNKSSLDKNQKHAQTNPNNYLHIENEKKQFLRPTPQQNNFNLAPVVHLPYNNTQANHVDVPIKNIQEQNEEQILNQVTSSILSNKDKKKKPLKQESKISQNRYEDGSSKMGSESKSLLQRALIRKKQKESKMKQYSHSRSNLSQKSQMNVQNNFHSLNNGNSSSFKNSSGQKSSKQSKNQAVQYVEYISPQSMRIEKLNQVSQNPMGQNSNLIAPKIVQQAAKNGVDYTAHMDHYSTYTNQNRKPQQDRLNQHQPNQYMTSPYNFASIAKQNQFITDRVDESANNSSQSRERKSIFQKNRQSVKAQSGLSQEASEKNSNQSKGYPKKSDFANALQAPIPSNFRDHFSQSQPSSEFKTCKAQLSNVEPEQNFVLNSNDYIQQQKEYKIPLLQQTQQNNNQPLYSAKSSGFSNSASIKLAMAQNKQYQLDDSQSYIQEPSSNPADNSYYCPKDIEEEVRQSLSPQFKNVFQIEKQLIPLAHNFGYDLPQLLADQSGSRTRKLGSSNLTSKQSLVKPHQQYMIAKLKREAGKQKDYDARELGSRVVSLKVENSRLRNHLISKKANQKSRQNDSDKYSSVQEFSNSKSNQSYSPQIRTHPSRSGVSAVSSIITQGNLINENLADRFFAEINDQKLKKACLRNKTIIYKSDLWEVGCMFKFAQQATNLTLYLTPSSMVTNFKYSISKQPNLEIQTSSKGYSEIPEWKQVKIEIMCKLQNIPYSLPIMNLKYRVGKDEKNISFYLPLTFNKFIKFSPVDPTKIAAQLRSVQKVVRTSQFDINSKVAKTSNILEYFPSMVNMGEQIKQKVTRYASMGTFRNEIFYILLTTKGKDKVLIQGKSSNPNYKQYVQYLMLTIKKLMGI